MRAEPVLAIDGLVVSFAGVPAVRGVSLSVARGERISIVGQSGSGKTTVVGAVLRLLPAGGQIESGSIRVAGTEVTDAPERVLRGIRGSRIGLVPQDPATNLNPSLRIGAQIDDVLRARGMRGRAVRRRRVVDLMTEAGIPDAARRARQFPHEFSGGLRQRALIAIALASEPELLIADEPTSALDVTVQRQILDHLESLVAARRMAMLLITHDLGLAAGHSDRVVVMHDGRIEESGSARQVLLRPERAYTRRLIAAAPSLSRSAAVVTGTPDAAEQPIVVVEDLVKEYRSHGGRPPLRALGGVSFSVPTGTTVALVGESGSGKSTTARIVLGLDTATAGQVIVRGVDVAAAKREELRQVRRRMQPVFQDPFASLDPSYSIEDLIAEPLRINRVGGRAEQRRRVTELLDQVALPSYAAERRATELSGGQRQRVAIARALALSPELLICDEPVSALDVLVQDQILELLGDLQHRLGLSYLFITHDLAVVRQIAHSVVVLRGGEVVESGPTARIFADPAADYTRELLDAIPGRRLVGGR